MIKPEQSRAARGLLNWTQQDLANASGVSKTSITLFESGQSEIRTLNQKVIVQAFEDANIEFPDEHGVRKRTDRVEILKGTDALGRLWDDIFTTLKDKGGEVMITNVDETRTLAVEPTALVAHIERLKEHGITERLLSCRGDNNFLAPKEWYRWISKELFTFGMSSYIYSGKVAFQLWDTSIITLMHSKDAFESEKRRFDDLWMRSDIPTIGRANSRKKV